MKQHECEHCKNRSQLKHGTREWYEAAIACITIQLKGPMDNFTRATFVADRNDFRDELAQLVETPEAEP